MSRQKRVITRQTFVITSHQFVLRFPLVRPIDRLEKYSKVIVVCPQVTSMLEKNKNYQLNYLRFPPMDSVK